MTSVNKANEGQKIMLDDHLLSKSRITLDLYEQLVAEMKKIGAIEVHAAKSMICFSSIRNFAYVIQLGSNFIDIVLPFKEAYEDNMCFRKIKPIPGSDDFNHHMRICAVEDFNEEVRHYLRLAYQLSHE